MPTKKKMLLPICNVLPEALAGMRFYEPTERGLEQKLRERLQWLEKRRSNSPQTAD